jgi:hypothetical protein
LAPADNRDRHRNQEYSLIACLLILDYYPKCAHSSFLMRMHA